MGLSLDLCSGLLPTAQGRSTLYTHTTLSDRETACTDSHSDTQIKMSKMVLQKWEYVILLCIYIDLFPFVQEIAQSSVLPSSERGGQER